MVTSGNEGYADENFRVKMSLIHAEGFGESSQGGLLGQNALFGNNFQSALASWASLGAWKKHRKRGPNAFTSTKSEKIA